MDVRLNLSAWKNELTWMQLASKADGQQQSGWIIPKKCRTPITSGPDNDDADAVCVPSLVSCSREHCWFTSETRECIYRPWETQSCTEDVVRGEVKMLAGPFTMKRVTILMEIRERRRKKTISLFFFLSPNNTMSHEFNLPNWSPSVLGSNRSSVTYDSHLPKQHFRSLTSWLIIFYLFAN